MTYQNQVGHWQDMQSGLSGGTVDKELLDFEAGLEQEAGARSDKFDRFVFFSGQMTLGGLET